MKTTRTAEDFNSFGRGHLPALLGVEILTVAADGAVHSRLALRPELTREGRPGAERRGRAHRGLPLHADDSVAQVSHGKKAPSRQPPSRCA